MGKVPHAPVSAMSLPAMITYGRQYKEADDFNRKVSVLQFQGKDHRYYVLFPLLDLCPSLSEENQTKPNNS